MLPKQNRAELVKTFGKTRAKQITAIIQQLVKAPTPDKIKEYTEFVIDATADKLEVEAILKEMYQAETITQTQLKNALASPDGGAAMAQTELTRRQNNQKSTSTQESKMTIKQVEEEPTWFKELKAKCNFAETKEAKPKATAPAGPLFADGRNGLGEALFSSADKEKSLFGDPIVSAIARQIAKNKQTFYGDN